MVGLAIADAVVSFAGNNLVEFIIIVFTLAIVVVVVVVFVFKFSFIASLATIVAIVVEEL